LGTAEIQLLQHQAAAGALCKGGVAAGGKGLWALATNWNCLQIQLLLLLRLLTLGKLRAGSKET
jgi:hypothetical protein